MLFCLALHRSVDILLSNQSDYCILFALNASHIMHSLEGISMLTLVKWYTAVGSNWGFQLICWTVGKRWPKTNAERLDNFNSRLNCGNLGHFRNSETQIFAVLLGITYRYSSLFCLSVICLNHAKNKSKSN